jgi:hypothetical protein
MRACMSWRASHECERGLSHATTGVAAAVPTARPQTSRSGGILGQIPIRYPNSGRSGWYYLPKVRSFGWHLYQTKTAWTNV